MQTERKTIMANKGGVLTAGQYLSSCNDDYLLSDNGQYFAIMQRDGNFVLYHATSTQPPNPDLSRPYWASNTNQAQPSGQYFAIMQGDGNFVLYHGCDPTYGYWASNTNQGQYFAIMQDDGNFVLYHGTPSNLGAAYWATNTVVQGSIPTTASGPTCVNGSITFDGSTALYPLAHAVANSYAKTCTGATINAKQSGSGVGLSEVAAGTVDIGHSDIFANPTSYSGLVDHQVAVVVYSVVLNPKATGISTLSSQQLIGIYSGKITNWKDVGGPDLPIVTVSRPINSGTRATFERFVLNGPSTVAGPNTLTTSTSSSAAMNVMQTAGAIGYVSTFYAQQNGLISIQIDGLSANLANVKNNSYKFWSIAHMYTKGAATGLADVFITYIGSNSPDVVAARQTYGCIALSDMSTSALSAKQ
jgi:phosphate transport system substrate-binding protein